MVTPWFWPRLRALPTRSQPSSYFNLSSTSSPLTQQMQEIHYTQYSNAEHNTTPLHGALLRTLLAVRMGRWSASCSHSPPRARGRTPAQRTRPPTHTTTSRTALPPPRSRSPLTAASLVVYWLPSVSRTSLPFCFFMMRSSISGRKARIRPCEGGG